MRTTIVLEDEIGRLVSPMASKKKLSRFINQCFIIFPFSPISPFSFVTLH